MDVINLFQNSQSKLYIHACCCWELNYVYICPRSNARIVAFAECTDEGDNKVKVNQDDKDNFVITDNSDDPNGPTDGVTNDDVPVFEEEPATIVPAPDGQTPYSITFETPDNTEDTPMSVNTPNLTNVKKIVVKVNGEELLQVGS
jgi:hypothetical protein